MVCDCYLFSNQSSKQRIKDQVEDGGGEDDDDDDETRKMLRSKKVNKYNKKN